MGTLFASATRNLAAIARLNSKRAAGGPAGLKIVLLLGGVLGLDAADRACISAVAGSLKSTFHIANTELGLLIAAASFVGAMFSLPGGALADRVNRKYILLSAIGLWTVAAVMSGTATSYAYLLTTRLFLGALTAAATPAIASLIGDFFPPQARSRIYGLILAGELVGIAFGFLVAGEISIALDWRWAFYVMALPGALLAWLIWRFLPEPARGGQGWIRWDQDESTDAGNTESDLPPASDHRPAAEATPRPRKLSRRLGIHPRPDLILHEDPRRWNLLRAMTYLLRIPTYRLLIVASVLGYYFFAGVRAFAVIYLTQHYHASRGTVIALAAIVGCGALVGVIAGGRISDALLRRGHIAARIIVPGVAFLLVPLFIAPAVWTSQIVIGVTLMTCGAAALSAANPPLDAARLDVVHSTLWGRGEAGRMALRGTFEGGAPLLFGAMSGWFGGGDHGLEITYLIMLIPVLTAATLAIPLYRSYPRDVATAGASRP